MNSPLTIHVPEGFAPVRRRRHGQGRRRSALTLWLLFCLAIPASGTFAAGRNLNRSSERTRNEIPVLRAFGPVTQGVKDSVVRLDVDGKKAALAAVLDENGLVLTKASEVATGRLTAQLSDGRTVPASLLIEDEDSDLALVRVQATGLKPIAWAPGPVAVGQWALTPGVDSTAEAVGIVSSPVRQILPKQGFLGVTPDFEATSARLRDVLPGMGAEKAGVKPGDVILAVDNHPVRDSKELIKTLRQYRLGQKIKLRVRRGDQEWEATAELKPLAFEGRARRFNRQERMNRLGGELSKRAEGFPSAIQHDTVLQPWECGGPLLNLEGKAIGLNIARAGRVASYALPANLVQHVAEQLLKHTQMPVAHEGSF